MGGHSDQCTKTELRSWQHRQMLAPSPKSSGKSESVAFIGPPVEKEPRPLLISLLATPAAPLFYPVELD